MHSGIAPGDRDLKSSMMGKMTGIVGTFATALKTAGNSIVSAANKLKKATIGGAKKKAAKKTVKKTVKKTAKKSGAKKARK